MSPLERAMTSKDISLKDANKQVQRLLAKYKFGSTESLGTLKGVKAKLTVEEGVQPKFCSPRNVPYAIKPYFEKELSPVEYIRSGTGSKARKYTSLRGL